MATNICRYCYCSPPHRMPLNYRNQVQNALNDMATNISISQHLPGPTTSTRANFAPGSPHRVPGVADTCTQASKPAARTRYLWRAASDPPMSAGYLPRFRDWRILLASPRHQKHFEPSFVELNGMASYDVASNICQAIPMLVKLS